MTLLRVEDLSVRYPDSAEAAVASLSFDIDAGESVGIVGESGAGKSQTALALLGLLPANAIVAGSVRLAGTDVLRADASTLRKLRTRRISMVFQDPSTALNPYITIGKQLRIIVEQHELAGRRLARRRCIAMLERVGLPDPERQYHSYPHQLSGGMRQRALLAAALIGEPDLLVADEPTTALDVTVQAQILDLLDALRSESATALLLITHDLGVIARSCERLIVMDRGRAIEQGSCLDVLRAPQHPHTAKLIEAVPKLTPSDAPRPSRKTEPVLVVDALSVSFRDRRRARRGEFVAVDAVSLDVQDGETLAIVGESGSGKTSVARAIAGLLPGRAGRLLLAGEALAWRAEARPLATRRRIQMVFQDPVASLDPSMCLRDIVAEPLRVHEPGLSRPDARDRVDRILARVGLQPALAKRLPHELSGGQAQRVAIARALIVEPRLLICDEALAALDGTVRREILALLQAEQQRLNMTLILITHDLGVVHMIADRVAVMYRGRICELAPSHQLFADPRHEYTRKLLAAVPTLER